MLYFGGRCKIHTEYLVVIMGQFSPNTQRGIMDSVELLKQNLAIEPDLRNFIGFILESVGALGGNSFAATIAVLELMQKLRLAGAGSGQPLSASLLLQDQQLRVQWGIDGDSVAVAHFDQLPPQQDAIEQLRQHLLSSTEQADPAILFQRNREMTRYFNETRARTEKELEVLQQSLEKRQNELLDSIHIAETDPLTGLLNRRAYDDKLGHAFRHTMRQKASPLSLILFDLDYFKKINDEFGHQHGDSYLQKMATCMLGVIRNDVDFAFRFGGDEFAILIFADYAYACAKARQVLGMMENKVSIGISTIRADTPDSLTLEEFIHRADNALYKAKHRGRGRVVVDCCPLDDSSGCGSFCQEMPDASHA